MTIYAKLSPKIPFELLRDLNWCPAYNVGAMYYYYDFIDTSPDCCYIVRDMTPEDEVVLRLSGYLAATMIGAAFIDELLIKELK